MFLLIVALALVGCGPAPRPHILLITFDTTRADHVGFASGQPGLTPMLDAMAERGVWFPTCLTPQPLTLPSHTSIMTGLYPFSHGVRNNGTYIVPSETVTLAERLQEEGYATHAVVSAVVLDSQFGLDQGFHGYDDDFSGGPKQKMFMFKEIKADAVARKAVRWLEQERSKEKPFFLWLHFFDPHADYEPPADLAAQFPGEPYRGEIAFADRELGRVFASLDDAGLLDETLVVFASDHGEGLGEHGETTHGIFIYESTTRVPMLIAGPGVPAAGRIDPLVRTVDIVPTILDLLDLPGERDLDGKSLRPLWEGKNDERTAYLETFVPRLNFGWAELRGLRDANLKVIHAPRSENYDLTHDPTEVKDLHGTGDMQGEWDRLTKDLGGMIETDPFTRGEQRPDDISDETRDKLAALGYVWTATESEATGPRPDPKDRIAYWEQFQQSQNLMRDGDFEAAVVAVRELLAVDPDNVVAMGSLANALARTGHEDEALEVYRRMMVLDPHRETSYLGSAKILREQGRFDEAADLARAAIEMQPNDPQGHTSLGDTFLEQNRFPEAEQHFRKALEIDPHSMLAASGLGNCLNRAGRLDEALAVLNAARAHDPSSHAVTYNLAVVTERKGDQPAALALYREAIELEPEHSMSWNNLGSLMDRLGNRHQAIEYVAKAHELDPENIEATYNLGALLFAEGDAEKALPFLEEAATRRPELLQATIFRARALSTLGRDEEALVIWRQLAARQPGAWLQVARLELGRGNRKAAKTALNEALSRGGDKARQAAEKDPGLRELL